MKDPFIDRLTELASRDPRVMLITGDLGFGMVERFISKCPRQFVNAGVAEQLMTGLATGLALDGKIVFTYSIANFGTLRCLEQIRNDAAYHGANVKVVAMGGGFSYGALGISHHATEDIAILRSLPELTVVAPGDDWEAAEATEALAYHPGTGYLRLDKTSALGRQGEEKFILGKARVLREGEDVTLVGTGGIVQVILQAAEALAKENIHSRVISMHTIKPLDEGILQKAVRETGGVIVVEEHSLHGGLGGAVAESLMDHGNIPEVFHRMGLKAGFSSVVGSQAYLRNRYHLDKDAIIAAVKERIQGTCVPKRPSPSAPLEVSP